MAESLPLPGLSLREEPLPGPGAAEGEAELSLSLARTKTRSYGSTATVLVPLAERYVEHRLSPGDTLPGLALKYGVTVSREGGWPGGPGGHGRGSGKVPVGSRAVRAAPSSTREGTGRPPWKRAEGPPFSASKGSGGPPPPAWAELATPTSGRAEENPLHEREGTPNTSKGTDPP